MKGYSAAELARSFRTVRTNTNQIAEEIPEDKYGFRPAEGARTVAESLAHIAAITRFSKQMHSERITVGTMERFSAAMADNAKQEAALTTKAQIVEALRHNGDEFAAWLDSLPDEMLEEKVHFAPPIQMDPKSRFEMLLGVKEHEMHHRGQLMLVERILGIVPHLTRQMQERMAAMQAPQPKTETAAG